MQHKVNRWELLFAVGLMLVLVVGLWGTSGSGMVLGSQVLAAGAPQLTNGGGNESSAILTTGTGTGKVMPALSAPGQVAFWTSVINLSGDNNLYWDNANKRLGIGTTSPQRPVHLVGNICLFERSSNSAGFIINRNGGDVSGYNRWVFGADEPTGFVIKTYPWDGATAVEQLVISKDNPSTPENESRVGIGTTSPTFGKLQVESDGESAIYVKDNSSGNCGYMGGTSEAVRGSSSSGTVCVRRQQQRHRCGRLQQQRLRCLWLQRHWSCWIF